MSRLHHLSLLALLATGCASTSTMGLARTLNKGAVQGWVAGEGGGIIVPATTSSPGSSGPGTGYPMVEGGVRFGASDHVELGARLGFNGLTLEGKFALLRSPTMDSGVNLSLNPMVGFFGLTLGSAFLGNVAFQLPVLIGIDFAGHELVFGPRLYDQLYFGGVSTGTTSGSVALNLLSAGGSIGFAIKAQRDSLDFLVMLQFHLEQPDEFDGDARLGHLQGGDHRRQQPGGGHRARADAHGAGLGAARGGQPAAQRQGARLHLPRGVGDGQRCGGGLPDKPADRRRWPGAQAPAALRPHG
jgi:hypothetical protein